MKNKNNTSSFCVLIVLFLITIVFSLTYGSSDIAQSKIISILFSKGGDSVTRSILWQIRLPRLILGVFVGAGLAVCGAVFQSMLRNPLASPYTLGISGGSAFGAALGIILGISGFFLPLAAFLGGIISLATIYLIARRKRFSNSALILSGVILSFTFSSLVLFLFVVSRSQRVHSALLWLIGDLSSAPESVIGAVPAIVTAGILILLFYGRDINILTLGDEKALYLGIRVETIKKIIFVTASFITAACVSASGIISFVGLIIPHFMRYFFGLNHRRLIIACAFSGAVFLVLSDLAARVIIKPLELPAGVITGFFGGIFFLIFLLRAKNWEIL